MQKVSFLKNREDYKRDTYPLRSYVEQAAFFIARMKNITVEAARDFVLSGLRRGGAFEFKDPEVTYLHREDFSDRQLKTTTMSRYIADVVENNESMAPTFTTYCSPDVKQSLLSLYTIDNIKQRDVIKGEMFDARDANDQVLFVFKDLGQNNKKTTNNSLSGASLTPSTALLNPTSHSSLTTNCRNTTAYGNANNEKFIEGNRHYMGVDIILNNLISISLLSDLDKIERAMSEFQLHYPTVDDVLDCIERSRRLYFQSTQHMGAIYEFINKMKPLERAAFVYVGDLYHMHKHNPTFVVDFILNMVQKKTFDISIDEAKAIMKELNGDVINLARQICRSFTAGMKPSAILQEQPDNYITLASTAKHVNDSLVHWQPIIDAFWMSENMPASTAHFPYSIRRSVLGGDTDSTLFTVQDWVLRTHGVIGFTDEMESVSDAIIFLAAQTSSHLHAKMSANYGFHPDRIFDTVMKNEYKFGYFVTTLMAKHYWAMKKAQEGNVYTKPSLELKGANMISSATPGTIVEEVKRMLLDQMIQLTNGEKLSLDELIDDIRDVELRIFNDVKSGSTEFFKSAYIKPYQGYKLADPDRTPYWNHVFWNATFGKVYGLMDEPPYTAVKVSLEVNNITEWKMFLDKIENKSLVADIEAELARIGRRFLTTAYIPSPIVNVSGIPDEILMGSNARKIVRECCSAYYHILDSMGMSMSNKKNTRMIYDTY